MWQPTMTLRSPAKPARVVTWVQVCSPFNSIHLQARALCSILETELGVATEVFSADKQQLRSLLRAHRGGSPVIWHYGGFDPGLILAGRLCDPILVYHNITPAWFFWRTAPLVGLRAVAGRLQLRSLKAKRWLANSRYNQRELVELGFRGVKLWPYVLAFEGRSTTAKAARPQVVFTGRIVENKNCIELLEAVDRAASLLGEQITLVVVGSGKKSSRYLRAFRCRLRGIQERGRVACVWHESNLARSDLEKIYAKSWLFVSASLHEGFGLPHCEAVLQGTPATYLQCGGTEDVLDGQGLVPHARRATFGDEIAALLHNPGRRDDLLERQRAIVERYRREQLSGLVEPILGPWLGINEGSAPLQ